MEAPIVISGTGVYLPSNKISNEELVTSFNSYVDKYNHENRQAIQEGKLVNLEYSSSSFIEKASGIRSRSVVDKQGILDPQRMRPFFPARKDEEPSLQSELACKAIHTALDHAQKMPQEIDGLIMSCVYMQRPYPSVAIEIQKALGFKGYAFDMIGGCSSATFGLTVATNAIKSGQNRCIVVVNPEIATPQVNFRDRDSHFIFADACTATIIELATTAKVPGFEILDTKMSTDFSNNIRNNCGFMNHTEVGNDEPIPRYFFKQNGRKVFKEVVPMVEEHILAHLSSLSLKTEQIKRYWLHQANINMNELIIKKILGRDPNPLEAPIILDQYGNTTSCGSLIAFHQYSEDLKPGDLGVICSFGAGYSICSIIVKKR